MDHYVVYQWLGALVVSCPLLLVVILGVTSIPERTLSERAISRVTQVLVTIALCAACGVLILMLLHGDRVVTIGPWNLVSVGRHDLAAAHDSGHARFHFEVKFVFDRLSVPFVILTLALCLTIGAFARSYLHQEPGYRRFFVLYSVFLLGMVVSSLAGSIETMFAGWELVGLSSALLVVFYHERPGPVRNSLRVWSVYRIADAAFLIAAITVHSMTGEGDFAGLMGTGAWPGGQTTITPQQSLYVGLLLLVAAAGKSALIPFSGWLPRAMEGPTPSSAIFYGALSVHLGAFLLLRISPILDRSTLLSVLVFLLGISTAGLAALTARVQTDIKSLLSFASLTQVGLIVAEIGCGLRYLALVHLLGHACLRTLQLVRAPSLLLDHQRLENAVGNSSARADDSQTPGSTQLALYRLAMERGYLDIGIDCCVVQPFLRALRSCDRWERRWTAWLSGEPLPQPTAADVSTHGPPGGGSQPRSSINQGSAS